ncbi:MAG: 30S ribosome-binding factor RbfA [Microthrixaceae bacterium]|nr:30S ribosome-binding factor RbfA [Microthrixaceae bacterium]
MARRRPVAKRQYARTDRVAEVIREIVAPEIERIGDERLDMVTVTAVQVDGSLEHATVYYSAMSAEADGRADDVEEALEDIRWRIQKLINREMRTRKTPQISFEADTVLASALRIDEILRDISEHEGDSGSGDNVGDEPVATEE